MTTWLESIAEYIEERSVSNFEYKLGKLVLTKNLFIHNAPRDSDKEDIVVIESDENHGVAVAGDPRRYPVLAALVIAPSWEAMDVRLEEMRTILYGKYGEASVYNVPDNSSPVAAIQVKSVGEPKRLLDEFGRCKVIQDYNIIYVSLT